LHNKSIGCGASGAYALGPDEKKKKKKASLSILPVSFLTPH